MPLSSHHKQRPEVRQALLRVAAHANPDVEQTIDAFNTLRDRLRRRLETMFGSGAIDALFERSRKLAADEFAWLPAAMPDGARPFPRAIQPNQRSSQSVPDAGELLNGLIAVLSHDIALLMLFVGEDFVLPLVRQAWTNANLTPSDESE